ncbi:MAG: RNA polymerase sigma factor [Ilumatobacteraceae bacterium]
MSSARDAVNDRPHDALEDLYRRDFVRAAKLAHLLTGSNAAAEDIAHDAFVRVQAKLSTTTNPSGYLTVTVVNLCRNWHRSRGRDDARLRFVATFEQSDEPTHEALLEVVDRLPFRQRTVLVARYWLDLSEAEIADLLGCRRGTVKSLASRAMTALRKELT